QHYGILLQTDARLHLGCSGGALINLEGELIGLTTATAPIQGGETPAGFAVPLNAGMRRIIDLLGQGREVEYGFLEVGFDTKSPPTKGVRITSVAEGSPADKAGLRDDGDVIVALDDRPIDDIDDLFLALGLAGAGAEVRLKCHRGPERLAVEVKA